MAPIYLCIFIACVALTAANPIIPQLPSNDQIYFPDNGYGHHAVSNPSEMNPSKMNPANMNPADMKPAELNFRELGQRVGNYFHDRTEALKKLFKPLENPDVKI